MPFRKRTPEQLYEDDDDTIVRYLLQARRLRLHDEEREALQILIFKHRGAMLAKVRAKLYDFPDHVIEELTDRAVFGAVRSAARAPFRESTLNQFKAWRNQIVANTIADFYDSTEPKKIRSTESIGAGRVGEDGEEYGHEPSVDGHEDDILDMLDAIDQAQPIEALLNQIAARDQHKAAAIRAVLSDELTAPEAADRYNQQTGKSVKPNTIDQWCTRLRKAARGDDEVTS